MRRILRKVAEGETTNLGNATLLDSQVVDKIPTGKKWPAAYLNLTRAAESGSAARSLSGSY